MKNKFTNWSTVLRPTALANLPVKGHIVTVGNWQKKKTKSSLRYTHSHLPSFLPSFKPCLDGCLFTEAPPWPNEIITPPYPT